MAGIAVIGYRNLIDGATLSASSAVATLPVSNLQHEHVAKVWRSAPGEPSAWLLADLLSQATIGATALIGCNMGTTGTVRVRLSTADATGAAGDGYDSGVVAAGVDPAYGMLVHLLPGDRTGRWLRLDLEESALSEYEAGVWAALPLWRPEFNFEFGGGPGFDDPSGKSYARGGQRWLDQRPKHRVVELTFPAIQRTEVTGDAWELERLNGIVKPILVVTDVESDSLGRDSIWGEIENQDLLRRLNPFDFRRAYRVREIL